LSDERAPDRATELPGASYAKALHTANHPRIIVSATGAEENAMKADTISLRRRHLMAAGLAAPVALCAAQYAGMAVAGAGAAERLVVSGRVLGASGRPLSGARVEILDPRSTAAIGAETDADGRFMLDSALADGQSVHYRVSRNGHATRSARLETAQLQRDETGAWRGTFGLMLA
jgi:hypothetical protein